MTALLLLWVIVGVEATWAADPPPGAGSEPKPKLGQPGRGPGTGLRKGGGGGARAGKPAAAGQRGVAIGKKSGPKSVMGTTLLRGGRAGAAAATFRQQLEKEPDSVQAQAGLGQALAETGECVEALVWLSATVGTLPFTADAAISAAACALHLGDRVEAVWYYQEGLRVDPEDPRLLTAYVVTLGPSGDSPELLRALDTLERIHEDGRDASIYARLALAADRGELDDFDWYAWLWEHEGRSPLELRALQARLWLELGDPWSAARELEGRARRHQRASTRAVRAEALRRTGNIGEAMYVLADRRSKSRQMRVDAVQARVEVDNGELDEAEATLQPYKGLLDPEVLASLYYLARARGEAQAAAEYASWYREMEASTLASLDQLVPLGGP